MCAGGAQGDSHVVELQRDLGGIAGIDRDGIGCSVGQAADADVAGGDVIFDLIAGLKAGLIAQDDLIAGDR